MPDFLLIFLKAEKLVFEKLEGFFECSRKGYVVDSLNVPGRGMSSILFINIRH